MSDVIDRKIVEMQFNNDNFEKNTRKSMDTIDELKKKLDFGDVKNPFESMEKSTAHINIREIAKAISEAAKQYDILAYAAEAFRNIAVKGFESAMMAAINFTKALTIDQISAGWDKYNAKLENTQTIMNATGKDIDEVNAYLEKMMWFSDETSYSFADMTSSLATMVSSGADIDKIIPLIWGVANATSYAGKGASEFQIAIRNLTQAYGAGYMDLMNWKSIQLVNVNSKQLVQTFIDMGVALGKIKEGEVTVANFTSKLKDKWLDTEVMEAALGKWGEMMLDAYKLVNQGQFDTAGEAIEALSGGYERYVEEATKASQSAKSFKEAVDATKDAVSSGWMEVFDIIFGNFEKARETWTAVCNDLWDIFAASGEDRNNMLREAFDSSWDHLKKSIEETGVSFEDFEEELSKLYDGDAIYEGSNALELLIKNYGSLGEAFNEGAIKSEFIQKALLNLSRTIEGQAESTSGASKSLEEYQKLVKEIWGGQWDNGAARYKKLTDAGYEYAKVQELVNIQGKKGALTLEDVEKVMGKLNATEDENIELTNEQAKALRALAKEAGQAGTGFGDLIQNAEKMSGRELLADSIHNFLASIANFKNVVSEAWNEVFAYDRAKMIYNVLNAIHEFSKGLLDSSENTDTFRRVLVDIFTTLKVVTDLIAARFKYVTNVIGEFVDKLVEVGRQKYTNFDGFLDAVEEWIASFQKFGKTLEGLDYLPYIKDFGDTVISIYSTVADAVSNFFNRFNKDEDEAVKKTENFSDKIIKAFGAIGEFFANVFNTIHNVIVDFGNGIDAFLNGFFAKLNKITGSDIAAFLNTLTFSGAFVLAAKLLHGINKLFDETLVDLQKSLDSVLSALKDTLNNFSLGIDIARIKDVAIAIGILAAALAVLFYLGTKDPMALAEAIGAMGAIMTGLGVLMNQMLNTFKAARNVKLMAARSSAIVKVMLSLVPFASAIFIVAGAIAMIGTLDYGKMWSATAVIGVLGAGLAGIMELEKTLSKGSSSPWKAIVYLEELKPFALALFGVSLSVALIASLDYGKMWSATAVIGVLGAGLAGIMALEKSLSKGRSSPEKATAMLEGLKPFMFALLEFAAAVWLIGSLDPAVYSQGLGGVTYLALMMVGVLAAVNKITAVKVNEGEVVQTTKVMGQLVGLGFAMFLFIGAIEWVGRTDIEVYYKGFARLTEMFIEIGAFLVVVNKFGNLDHPLQTMGSLILLGAAMFEFVDSIKELGSMPFSMIVQGIIGFGAVLTEIAGFLAAVKIVNALVSSIGAAQATDVSGSMLGLVALGAAMVLFAKAIVPLGEMNFWSVVSGVTALGAVMAEIVTFMLAWKAVGLGKGSAQSLALIGIGLAAMAAALTLLGKSLEEVTKSVVNSLVYLGNSGPQLVQAIVQIVFSLLEALEQTGAKVIETVLKFVDDLLKQLVEYVPSYVDSILELIKMILQTLATKTPEIVAMAKEFIDIVFNAIGQLFEGISPEQFGIALVVAGIIAALVAAYSAIAPMVPTAMIGVAGAAAVIAEGIAIVAAFGEISSAIPGLQEAVDKGGDLLGSLGTAFGKLIGGFIGGAVEQFSNSLPTIGANLSAFIVALSPGLIMLQTITGQMVEGAGLLAIIMVELVGDTVVGAIASVVANISNFLGIKRGIAGFVEGIQPYLDVLEKVKPGMATASKDLAELLLYLTGAEVIEGIASFFGLNKKGKFESFKSDLTAFGDAISGYAEKVGKLDASTVQKVVNSSKAAQIIVDILNTVADTDYGDDKVTNFGTNIEAFAGSLVTYATTVGAFSEEKVRYIKNSASAAQAIIDFANNISGEGGLWQKLVGEKDLSGFGEKIADFAPSLMSYIASIGEFDEAKITNVKNSAIAAQAIIDFANNISGQNGLWQKIAGSKDLGDFGEQISTFGESLKEYYGYIDGITWYKVTTSANVLETLSDATKTLSTTKSNTLTVFGKDLVIYGGKIKDYYDKVANVSVEHFRNVSDEIKHLIDVMDGVSKIDMADLVTFENTMANIGKSGISSLLTSFDNAVGNIQQKCSQLTAIMINTFKARVPDFKSIGRDFVQGLANGIIENSYLATQAASQVAGNAADAMRQKLDEHSPSKVGYEIGHFFGLGFINALIDSVKESKAAGQELAQSAKDGLNKAIEMINGISDFNLSYEMTITPVLDLSGIQNGKDAIKAILNSGLSYSGSLAYSAVDASNKKAESKYSVEATITKDDLKEFAKELEENVGTTFNNEFNIQSDDPKGVANEVSGVIQHQIERRREVWA